MKTLAVLLISFLSFSPMYAQEQVPPRTIVYFEFDKHQLRPKEKSNLDEIIETYKSGHLDGNIIIKGHTDFVGSAEYNELLARKRTFSVHEYLLNNGIPKTLVSIESFGE